VPGRSPSRRPMTPSRIGVDIGGTFTDLVLLDGAGRIFVAKISSTPAHPEQAVIEGIARLLETALVRAAEVGEVVHGTTVGSNTLLERTGARTGLITTKGFRDILEIGRVRTPGMFDLTWDKPEPLVERRYRHEIRERIAADGGIVEALVGEDVTAAGEALLAEGIRSVAICLINSYRNPEHERRATELLRRRFPDLEVTASVDVLPEAKEYERTSTAAVNAYVVPVMRSYLRRLEDGLRGLGIGGPLLVVNSSGGLSASATAQAKPVFFISSGPAAGVVGAARLGEVAGERDLIVFDMGGTTAKAALVVGGKVSRTNEYEFRAGMSTPSRFIKAGGYMMKVPAVDVAEVGSGAGSIASVDAGGLIHVGPRSAGADPGPASYGLGGTEPTVTDANVVLGGLNPVALAAGTLKLDRRLAGEAIERRLAGPLKLSLEQSAYGIREVVNANMARAIRAVTVERGVDPRDFTLVAFGGSGPVHACDLAASLGIGRVLFPNLPGVFTAVGMLASDVERFVVRAFPTPLAALEVAAMEQALEELRAEAATVLAEEGYGVGEAEFRLEADLRYKGQDSELSIPVALPLGGDVASRLANTFRDEYRAVYQYASDGAVELVALRAVGRGLRRTKLDFAGMRIVNDQPAPGAIGKRRVYYGPAAGWVETPVLRRADIAGRLAGPAIVESADTTIVLPPGWGVESDGTGDLIATRAAE
jgi:N-methylhydantoinase A